MINIEFIMSIEAIRVSLATPRDSLLPRGQRFQLLIRDCHVQETITVNTLNTVYHVKEMIENLIGVPPNQQLIFQNPDLPRLEDNRTLGSYHVEMLAMVWLLSPSLKLLIKMQQAGTSLCLHVYSPNSISKIKDIIRDKTGVRSERQTLVYSGKSLCNDKALSFYNIPRNATIYVIFGLNDGTAELELSIENAGKEALVIKVKPWFTILDMKAVIESSWGIPVGIQELVYFEKKLIDWKTVRDYNMKDKSSISLVICSSQMQIYIKPKSEDENKSAIMIEANNTDTIDTIINKIPQEEVEIINGLPGLFLGEIRLMGDKTLAHYNIGTGALLSLERAIQINVLIPRGETIKVNLKASYSIHTAKVKIEALCGIPDELQSLTYNGDEMDDLLSLEHCEAVFGSLWALRWNWGDKTWSFFWPSYLG